MAGRAGRCCTPRPSRASQKRSPTTGNSPVNPYFTERLAKEHRDDLLRAAETSRLAHFAEIKGRKHLRWWSFSASMPDPSKQRAAAERLGTRQVRDLGRG
jgi:hypothetical protein